MKIREYVQSKANGTRMGARLLYDRRYRVITKAVLRLTCNLLFAFYNGILGILSASLIFVSSAVYYLLLSTMRFFVVMWERKSRGQKDRQTIALIGIMLIVLGVGFHVMVLMSMQYKTAAVYGTIPMIAIATFTFTKITVAIVSAVKHCRENDRLLHAVNAIRYSEIAVSLLAMQQSMLVSFDGEGNLSAIILNACTGAGVCIFILALGIITLKNNRKEPIWPSQKLRKQTKKWKKQS